MTPSLRIAVLGARGVPATFGGVERHVQEIGRRLVQRGHEVTVFCESGYVGEHDVGAVSEYEGMRRVIVPSVRSKHFEALAHSARSTRRALGDGYDIVHYHAVGPGVFSFVPRWFGSSKVVQTIHGLDAERAKWGRVARTSLRGATWLSAKVPDATVVVSAALAEHYRVRYGRTCVYIPNGTEVRPHRPAQLITERFGLRSDSYLLFVGRLVPEKCPDLLVSAYGGVPGDRSLVLAGGTSHTDEYVEAVNTAAVADRRAQILGYVYGDALDELYANASAFVLPSDLEGLPLTLLEALGGGTPVIASDIAPHVEVLERSQPGGRLFPAGDRDGLASTIVDVLGHLPGERAGAAALAGSVRRRYDWDRSTDQLEELYRDLTR